MRQKEATYNFFKSGSSFCYWGIFSGSDNEKVSPALNNFPFHVFYFRMASFIVSSLQKQKTSLFRQKKNYPTTFQLSQWHFTSEVQSLMQLHYAQKPRNPE